VNLFDKICGVLAIIIGALLLVIGIMGIFIGSAAHFTLPPLLGALPFFLGWSMCISTIKFWKQSNRIAQFGYFICPNCKHDGVLTTMGTFRCSGCGVIVSITAQ